MSGCPASADGTCLPACPGAARPGECVAEKQAAYAASRAAARATAEAALAAAIAHTTRMEAAGYRLQGAVWVWAGAGTAAEAAQQAENGAGVAIDGRGA